MISIIDGLNRGSSVMHGKGALMSVAVKTIACSTITELPARVLNGIDRCNQDLLAWARLYQELGLKPLPRRRGGKHPGVRWKEFQTRYPTDAELKIWFRDPGTTGICTVLDGTDFVVVELDAATPERLPDAYRLLAGIQIPHACPHVASGSGRSAQYWFRARRPVNSRYVSAIVHPDGTAKQGGAQIDILGRGIVVLPPTPHVSTGKRYTWCPPFIKREYVPELT